MGTMKSRRSFKNARLTAGFRVSYLGLWALLVLANTVVIDGLLYLYYDQRQADLADAMADSAAYGELFPPAVMALVVGAHLLLTLIAVLALVSVTVQRVAGPFIALQRTFSAIREGRPGTRLKFRAGDRLDHLAEEFNSMMDAVERRAGRAEGDSRA